MSFSSNTSSKCHFIWGHFTTTRQQHLWSDCFVIPSLFLLLLTLKCLCMYLMQLLFKYLFCQSHLLYLLCLSFRKCFVSALKKALRKCRFIIIENLMSNDWIVACFAILNTRVFLCIKVANRTTDVCVVTALYLFHLYLHTDTSRLNTLMRIYWIGRKQKISS